MKPRLAIVAMIALGALLSFSGSGLAISGISGSGDVSVAQYEPDVLPDVDEGDVEEVGVVGVAEEPADADAVQPTRQVVAAEDGALPFTGLAAIPLIGIGVGLMAGGLALHRRTRQSQGQ